jgi:hypothetical protein
MVISFLLYATAHAVEFDNNYARCRNGTSLDRGSQIHFGKRNDLPSSRLVGASSTTEEIQGAVRKPALQLTDDFHRALPDWACHHADFRGGPEEKGAIATGTITLAGILIKPVPANVLLASPSVVVDVDEYGADTAILSGLSVAVGMRITPHPPHRSGLEELPHPALASGHDGTRKEGYRGDRFVPEVPSAGAGAACGSTAHSRCRF